MKSPHHRYQRNIFTIENVALLRIAEKVGTPFYVYSRAQIEDAFNSYEAAFRAIPHTVCFAMKANGNVAVGRVLSRMGAGADIVSAGELHRALKAGFPKDKIVFSGVGKTKDEMVLAIQAGIRMINVESEEELSTLNFVAASLRKPAPFSLRVNPDVRAGGHPHISTGTPKNKFGVHHRHIFPLYKWASKQRYLKPLGIQSHIGSQITRVAPYRRALTVLMDLHRSLSNAGVHLGIVDLGGGLGVDYNGDNPQTPKDLASILVPTLKSSGLTLFLEPGRSLIAQAGALITKVLYRKAAGSKHFVIVDAAMNDLARPALYDAYHEILPVHQSKGRKMTVDVVGPVCESGDYLARARPMRLPEQNELLAVLTAGAYGFSMSSQYNARPRVPEVLVSGSRFDVIRSRETISDLMKGEVIPKNLR